ncbi:unnamed protein product [Symbiodinium natans]|uniref:Enhancer of rudimentary homolog n=1 Tax=Symbiodinium natans TaxID=878477 RepID=A0A812IBH7_9DINO|nr:unnamed protein product [Symbiodinium natans]
MDDVCQMYEQMMKMDMGSKQQVKYTVEDLWSFIDRLRDIAIMIYDSQVGEYLPHNREWAKNQAADSTLVIPCISVQCSVLTMMASTT